MQITDVAMYEEIETYNQPDVSINTSVGLDIGWHDNHLGFGRLIIEADEDGKVSIDTEHIDKDHFLQVMSALYDMAEVK